MFVFCLKFFHELRDCERAHVHNFWNGRPEQVYVYTEKNKLLELFNINVGKKQMEEYFENHPSVALPQKIITALSIEQVKSHTRVIAGK